MTGDDPEPSRVSGNEEHRQTAAEAIRAVRIILAKVERPAGGDMDIHLLTEGDRLEVMTPEGRRYTFPIAELQVRRRAPRPSDLDRAADLPTTSPLWGLEQARRAAEEYAIVNDLM